MVDHIRVRGGRVVHARREPFSTTLCGQVLGDLPKNVSDPVTCTKCKVEMDRPQIGDEVFKGFGGIGYTIQSVGPREVTAKAKGGSYDTCRFSIADLELVCTGIWHVAGARS